MTTLREAATQALEALENFGMKHYENTGEVLHRDVYEALKEALAEDAMQKFTDVNQELEAELAEPVQEPVCDKDPRGCYSVRCQLGRMCKHATPPQRKPLTEEEITQCFAGADIIDCSSGQLWVKVARAIERAHGIT